MSRIDALMERKQALEESLSVELEADAEVAQVERLEAEVAELELREAVIKTARELRKELGKENEAFAHVPNPYLPVFVRLPAEPAFRYYMDRKDTDSQAIEEFVMACVIRPTKTEFRELLRHRMPGLLWRCENVAVALAHAKKEMLEKK